MAIFALPIEATFAHRLRGNPLVALLDIDGTLAPIAPRPEEAAISSATLQAIAELAALPRVVVAAISGRAVADARRMLGTNATWVLGNHGIEVAPPGDEPEVKQEVSRFADALSRARDRCQAAAARTPGVLIEDKRWIISVHYRLADPSAVPALVAEVTTVAHDFGLRAVQGKKVIELRPPLRIDKGTAAIELVDRLSALPPLGSVFCAGDDRTDEDAFAALRATHPACVTVFVGVGDGTQNTAAEFSVVDPGEMTALLVAIAEFRRAGSH